MLLVSPTFFVMVFQVPQPGAALNIDEDMKYERAVSIGIFT